MYMRHVSAIILILATGVSLTTHSQADAPSRYDLIDNGAAVLDKNTNLIWKRCEEGKHFEGAFCKGIATEMSWDDAMRYATKGWRLPSITELKSLSTPPNKDGIWIDPDFFPDTDPDTFWSSTANDTSPEAAWDFNFRTGFAFHGANRTYKSHVRLVRTKGLLDLRLPALATKPSSAHSPQARTRYIVTGNDEVVIDQRTGLMWKRCQEGKRLKGGSCEGKATKFNSYFSTKVSADGWRWPSKGELKSLIELNTSGWTTINEKIFPNTEPSEFWSSTLSYTNSGAAWAVDFGNGYDSGNVVRYTENFIRMVKAAP
jgi:hypothetical protein